MQTNSDLVSGEIKPHSKTPRTDGLIGRAMARHPGQSVRDQANYYEDVHQDLAPLARQMEAEIIDLVKALQETRAAFVIAVGDKSPFSKIALEKIDAALAKAGANN